MGCAIFAFGLSKYRKNKQNGTSFANHGALASGEVGSSPSNWPTEPKRLGQKASIAIFNALFDGIMVALPLLFVILAVFAKYFDEKSVIEHPGGKQVITATEYGVTFYPIIFAAVMGKVVEMTAGWIIERGGTVLILEQLFGSTTLFGTLKTQFLLRAKNPHMFLLVLIWSLSPLGGQGTLRLINVEERPVVRPSPFWFLDMSQSTGEATIFYAPKSIGVQGTTVNTVFSTSLIAPDAIHNSTVDLWGNVKIPRLESLESLPDIDGWRAVPPMNVSYSSLVGIPVANVPKTGNSSFAIHSSYFEISCPEDAIVIPKSEEIIWFGNGTGQIRGSKEIVVGQGTFRKYGEMYGTIFGTALETTFSIATLPPSSRSAEIRALPLYFQSFVSHQGHDTDALAALSCAVTYPTAESRIQCRDGTCRVVAMRPATKNTSSPFASFLNDGTNSGVMLQAFVSASGPAINYPFYGSTLFEVYLASNLTGPLSNPSRMRMTNLSAVPGPILGERIGRLLNSFWIPSLVPLQITGNIAPAAEFVNRTSDHIGVFASNRTEGTVTVQEEIYICHDEWLAILLLSASTLFLCAAAATMLKYLTKGPMIFGHVSSFTRDNPFSPLPAEASTLDGYDRARLLKDTKIRLGDVEPDKPVGHIAIMTINDEKGNFTPLGKADSSRVYK